MINQQLRDVRVRVTTWKRLGEIETALVPFSAISRFALQVDAPVAWKSGVMPNTSSRMFGSAPTSRRSATFFSCPQSKLTSEQDEIFCPRFRNYSSQINIPPFACRQRKIMARLHRRRFGSRCTGLVRLLASESV